MSLVRSCAAFFLTQSLTSTILILVVVPTTLVVDLLWWFRYFCFALYKVYDEISMMRRKKKNVDSLKTDRTT